MKGNAKLGFLTIMAGMMGGTDPLLNLYQIRGEKKCPNCEKYHNRYHWKFCSKKCEDEFKIKEEVK